MLVETILRSMPCGVAAGRLALSGAGPGHARCAGRHSAQATGRDVVPAVDADMLAGDPGALVAAEEGDQVGDVRAGAATPVVRSIVEYSMVFSPAASCFFMYRPAAAGGSQP